MPVKGVLSVALVVAMQIAPAVAQSVTVGAGIHQNIQRFAGDPSLNRLDGQSRGWNVLGGTRLGHWVIRAEASRDATVRNADTTSLLVGTQPVTVHSELSHDMRDVAVLGGYATDLVRRVEVTILGGASTVGVHRAFTTDAGQQVLVPPSTVPPAAVTTTFDDRFTTWTVEGNGLIRVSARLGVIGGVRVHRISLREDITGVSVRPFIGGVWRLR
jgi:hypothetical protein